MNFAMKLSTAALAIALGLTPLSAQERVTMPEFSYSEGVRGNDCRIAFRSTDGSTWVDFGLGITDAAFTVEVLRNRWEAIDDKNASAEDLPVTLTFSNGRSTTSQYGGIKNGFRQGFWALWHDPANDPLDASQAALELLMEADSVTISNEDGVLTEANLGLRGFAANKLLDCALAERDKL